MQKGPRIENRTELHYVGERRTVSIHDLRREIPAMTGRVARLLETHRLRPSGKPLLRYHVIDMPKRLDVELGLPVADAAGAKGALEMATLPAGRYALLTYKGVDNGIAANKKLIDWIAEQGEEVVSHTSENGEAFKARYETFLTDAATEQDEAKWETEVAIKLRD